MSFSFRFTRSEFLYDRISHDRFTTLLNAPETAVLAIAESSNSFGEFLFVTLTAPLTHVRYGGPACTDKPVLTFWGLGYHEPRERWLINEWRWYETQFPSSHQHNQHTLSKGHAWDLINARLTDCRAEMATATPPTVRAQAYAILADLGDEDGALSELEDLEAMGFDVEELFDA